MPNESVNGTAMSAATRAIIAIPGLPPARYAPPAPSATQQRSKGNMDHANKTLNGVSHKDVTLPACEHLVALLESPEYGNRLSEDHKTALMAILGTMTEMAQGELRGRWAFGLPTGMGKTKSIEAWIATVNAAGLDHVSVAVAASKVEALCEMKRSLLELGVPEDKIGLVHAKRYDPGKVEAVGRGEAEGYATEPSEGADRQFMLVTHQRVRGCSLDSFNFYKGRPRDLMLYDESLIVSDSTGIPINHLKAAVGFFEGLHEGSKKYAPVIEYLTECRDRVTGELARLKDGAGGKGGNGIMRLPECSPETIEGYRAVLGRHSAVDVAHLLLDIADQDIRVVPTAQGGVVSYSVSVPEEIKNILVLDASTPIRKLVHLDPTIKDAEKLLPQIKRIGVPLSRLKRFDRVTIRQLFAGGGRSSMEKSFAQVRAEDRKVSKAVLEVVSAIPADEAALIFTYKLRPAEKVNFRRILLDDMRDGGVDIDAMIETEGGPKSRINVATWGMETALNCFAHCTHVILAGVLQRSPIDIAAASLGQTDTLAGPVDYASVKPLLNSEICHVIYQALSRGSCRMIDQGYAKPMTAYIIHRDDRIRDELERVMPGATWEVWETEHFGASTGVIAKLAVRIEEHLKGLLGEVWKVSLHALKRELDVADMPPQTFKLARDRALEAVPWAVDGRSLSRIF